VTVAFGCGAQGGARPAGTGGSAPASGGSSATGGVAGGGGRPGPAGGGGASGAAGTAATGGAVGSGGGAGSGGGGAAGHPTPSGSGGGGASGQEPKPHPPFVAFGYAALRSYSADGKTWTTAPAPTSLPSGWAGPPVSGDNQWLLRSGCFGAGLFVGVGGTAGDLGLVLTSTDGMTWSTAPGAQSNDDCAYGLGKFVTNFRTSPDGVTWTKVARAVSARQMVFGRGTFVAVADNGGGAVDASTDGSSWSALPISYVGTDSHRLGYNAVAYGNGRFLAINLSIDDSPIFEWDGASMSSFTETPRAALLGGNLTATALAYGRGEFVIATPGVLFHRPDGATTWTQTKYTGAGNLSSLVITDEIDVTDSAWSTDGVTFKPATNAPAAVQSVTRIVPTMR
jgi:hypothetical protein